ncbi:MAG: cytochrome c [Proteobacteria bacterium]|nr:cytochrome c [Pseudomonadota bacterium]MCP4919814.1 cytochrome c [Pseudomonadota bacterium]
MTLSLLFSILACGGETPEAEPAAPAAAPAPAAEPAPEPEPEPEPAAEAPAAKPGDAEAGKVVYDQYCVACHQADGTGMNGMLAASFVTDKDRLAKSDDELLTSIRDGMTGSIGMMPPWGTTLDQKQMEDSLAYIRATFGE